ncbi:type 2 lanthipeptide synthetase LanM [Micromonospora echinofusca]|uniref:type 2 lanthipeptide synthetase LanM n=1 Tax=Micromonospora echinofusca TaxID=47858 RepID=UPI0033E06385
MTVGFLPALSLTERVPVDGAGAYPVSDRARWRLSRWRDSQAFATAGAWQRRLAADACDEDVLLRLLDEPAAVIAARLAHPPEWSRRLQGLYSGPAPDDWRPERLPGRPLDDALVVAAPLLADARRRVREAAAELAGPATPVDPAAVDALGLAELLDELVRLLSRASVLELNVARVRGELTGPTPARRFATFFARMAQPRVALDFLTEYPVLARQLLTVVDAWASSTVEFLRRLRDDWAAIAPALGVRPDARLTGLTPAGDAHRGGRRVCVARFDDGSRVVYKPRDLAVDARFQRLLGWLARRDADLGLRPFGVLTRDGYGWTEFVAGAAPTSLPRYARHYGSLLALLHALGAGDCHPGNVVGAGDTPVLVDLETLFTPALERGRGAADGGAVASCVLAVGLLPAGEPPAGEAGACNCAEWLGAGTDEMQLHVPGVHVGHGAPAAVEGVRPADLRAYEADVVAGFRRAYDVLGAEAGVLADRVRAFAGDEIRVVLRPTRTYARLQEALLHTDHLRDALDRDRLLDWLWVGVEELPVLATTIAAERADLAAGDTPLFTARVGARDLWAGRDRRLPGALAGSALDGALRRIAGLGEADRERQVWLIRATFASLAETPDAPHAEVRWRPGPVPAEPSTFRPLLAQAAEIGERVAAMAHGGTWFTFGPTAGARWAPVPMGAGLYDGLSGLALFYGYLGEVTGHEDFTDLAAGIACRLGERLRADGFPLTAVGAFNGWGGPCYAYGHLATLWGDDPTVRAGLDLALTRLAALADDAGDADVVDGLAGAVLAVLACGAEPQRAVDLARRLGDRLVAALPAALRLGGLSHGAAGMATALFELWSVTGVERYAEAGRRALEFDRSLFDPASGNWADLRRPGLLSNAWCHGAPGIGLSRVRIRRALSRRPLPQVDGLDAEIAVALRTTFAHGFGRNHSLCHGDLGNLDLPLLAGADPAAVGAVVDGVLRDVAVHGWRCANPAGLDSPELMTGLAGIGYQLMRLAEPQRVPSLLTLAGAP